MSSECANCGTRFVVDYGLQVYCCQRCDYTADAVRVGRREVAEGWNPEDPEANPFKTGIVMGAIRHALVGGYDKKKRRLSTPKRNAIVERDGGCCVLCGQPGEEVDHINGNSSDPSNLRLLCAACHWSETARVGQPANPDVLTAEQSSSLAESIFRRILCTDPSRPCDDHANWNRLCRRWPREHRSPAVPASLLEA